jgi:hypothetical protein
MACIFNLVAIRRHIEANFFKQNADRFIFDRFFLELTESIERKPAFNDSRTGISGNWTRILLQLSPTRLLRWTKILESFS